MMQTPHDLADLHDVVTPEPVSWLPQTWAWFVVLGILAGLVSWAAWRAYARHRANAYRRAALAELDALSRIVQEPARRLEALQSLPILLKRTALQATPREAIAGTSGSKWLRYLDTGIGGSEFSDGPGQLLLRLAYEDLNDADIRDGETELLLALARRWITGHRAAALEPWT